MSVTLRTHNDGFCVTIPKEVDLDIDEVGMAMERQVVFYRHNRTKFLVIADTAEAQVDLWTHMFTVLIKFGLKAVLPQDNYNVNFELV